MFPITVQYNIPCCIFPFLSIVVDLATTLFARCPPRLPPSPYYSNGCVTLNKVLVLLTHPSDYILTALTFMLLPFAAQWWQCHYPPLPPNDAGPQSLWIDSITHLSSIIFTSPTPLPPTTSMSCTIILITPSYHPLSWPGISLIQHYQVCVLINNKLSITVTDDDDSELAFTFVQENGAGAQSHQLAVILSPHIIAIITPSYVVTSFSHVMSFRVGHFLQHVPFSGARFNQLPVTCHLVTEHVISSPARSI